MTPIHSINITLMYYTVKYAGLYVVLTTKRLKSDNDSKNRF